MVTKNCPQCEKQLPIASRICSCGHSFTKEKPSQAPGPTISSSRPRRTITRRPNLYSQVRPRQISKPRISPVARQPAHKPAKLLKTEDIKEEDSPNKGRNRAQSEPIQRVAPGLIEDPSKKRRARFRTLSSVFEQDSSVSNSESSSNSSTNGSRDEDMYSNLSAEKVMQYSIILDEINRKYMGQNFKPS